MSELVALPNEFEPINLEFCKVKVGDNGSKSVPLKYTFPSDLTDKLTIQTPKMMCPWGISDNEKYSNGDASKLKYSISLSFDGVEKSKQKGQFLAFNKIIDDLIKNKCLEKSEDWINDDDADEKTIRKAYSSSYAPFKPKKGSDATYSDMFRINVPWDKDNGRPYNNVEFYDENSNKVNYEYVTPGCSMIALYSINSIWLSPGLGKFGYTARLVMAYIFPKKKINGFCIRKVVESDDSESEDEGEAVEPKSKKVSDGEESEDDLGEYEA